MANDLWRDCANWLTRCGVLRPDHKANWPEATLTDLAFTLRDGVLLCNFLQSVDPTCIDMKDVNQKPQFAQFLCLRNIKTFLQACHEFYGLRESDLFDPSMLFDLTDLYKVLHTLSKLSNSPAMQRRGTLGFSIHKPRTLSQEDIYRNLSAAGVNTPSGEFIWPQFTIKSPEVGEKDEDIYEDLCYVHFSAEKGPYDFEQTKSCVTKLLQILKQYRIYCPVAPTASLLLDVWHLAPFVELTSNDLLRGGEEASCAVPEDCVEYAHYDTHIRNEEIYQDLCSIDKQYSPSIAVPTAISHSFEKRDYVITELIETEKNYIDVLNTLLRCFIRPLSSILKEDDVKVIFGGIKELHEIHVGFYDQLRKALPPGSGHRLSEAFLNWREKFLTYGDYCANLTIAQARIQEISSRNDNIYAKLTRCQQEANNGKFKLRDILSVPMQRILKYHLLLEKLLSETQPGHEDYRGLERAREAMVDVAQYINEVKRDSDTLQIMADIQASITDWEGMEDTKLTSFGRLLKDGDLRIKSHDNQKIRQRYVFIFDKVMLMCKTLRNDQYSFKCCLPLSDYKIEDTSNRRTLHKNTSWHYQFFLIHKSERTAFTLYARTEEIKRKWIKAIQDALDNIEPAGCRSTDHKFVMHTFGKPTICMHCSKFLKGRIFQGYRCEKCDIAAHKLCIANSGRCGAKMPPELPPRPPLAARQESEINGHQPLPPRPTSGVSPDINRAWPDHTALAEYLWFVGEMGRERASRLLETQLDGTYLLRIRPQGATHPNETVYALSLKADDKVKHMKVYEKEMDGEPHYYLSESRFFRSLVELVNCYEHTSLVENFHGLDVRLRWPFRRIIAIADFDFNPVEANQLPLKQGCQVIILSKEGDHKGWWKGMIQDRVGFFPKVYVREVSDTLNCLHDLQ